ncbi:hypothetical protein LV779_08810 [Streptomyces thinghirensis]|nr:hypothetical protein [Streptomyces thinghirensis]
MAEATATAADAELETLLPADPGRCDADAASGAVLRPSDRSEGSTTSAGSGSTPGRPEPLPAHAARPCRRPEAAWRTGWSRSSAKACGGRVPTEDPLVAAIQILVVLDGLGMLVNSADTTDDPPAGPADARHHGGTRTGPAPQAPDDPDTPNRPAPKE